MEIEQILAQFSKVKPAGRDRWRAVAPCHNGSDPQTLSVTRYPDGVGLKCFAGCSQDDVLQAAGLKWQDLIPGYEDSTPEERRYAKHANELKRKNKKLSQWAIDAIEDALEQFWERDLQSRLRLHVGQLFREEWDGVMENEDLWS